MYDPSNPFADMESDFDGQVTTKSDTKATTGDFLVDSVNRAVSFKCPKCRGTGNAFGGKCYACNGRGGFHTSPEQRAQARANSKARKHTVVLENANSAHNFLQSRPDIAAWFQRNTQRGNEFAKSLADALLKYGSLTEGQLAAVERSLVKDAEYAAQRAAQAAQAPAPSQDGLDLSSIPAGRYAVPGGDTRLKIRIDRPTHGNWVGFTFVKDAAEYGMGKRYGKQAPGQLYRGEIIEQLKAIMADPKAASAAYGKLVGSCGVCGRLLEDAHSIEIGIGPICAGKLGWG